MIFPLTNTQTIQQLYVAFFGRPADSAGLGYWTHALEQGIPLSSIREQFAQSSEFKNLIADKSTAWQVNKLYLNLFGREADANGLRHYTDVLDNSKGNHASVVGDIIRAAAGEDPATIGRKVLGAQMFTTVLRVDPLDMIGYQHDQAEGRAYLASVIGGRSLMVSLATLADIMEGKNGAVERTAPGAESVAPSTQPIEATVQQLYLAYIKRPADVPGLLHFSALAGKESLEQVSRVFAKSVPFQDSIKGLAHSDIVDRLYLNLFGHSADSENLKFYGDALASGQTSVDQVVLNVIAGAQMQDRELLDNRTIAAELFTTALESGHELVNAYFPSPGTGAQYMAAINSDASVYAALRDLSDVLQKMLVAPIPAADAALFG